MSNELTAQDLQEKIKKVQEDIEQLRLTGDTSRKLQVLSEYKEYLEDELKFVRSNS